jgi:hypothetical protein
MCRDKVFNIFELIVSDTFKQEYQYKIVLIEENAASPGNPIKKIHVVFLVYNKFFI